MTNIIKAYWLVLLVSVPVLGVVLLAFKRPDAVERLDTYAQAFLALLAWFVFVARFLYEKRERFYLLVNNARFWITNRSTHWNVTIELRGIDTESALEDALSAIADRVSSDATIWHDAPRKKILNLAGYTLRLRLLPEPGADYLPDQDSPHDVLVIQISDLELPFRSFTRKLEKQIIPILHSILQALDPRQEKYSAKIRFGSGNPYFGFFVRHLDVPQVTSFAVDVADTTAAGTEQRVCIRKRQIEIVTDNLLALSTLSRKYVALSLPD